MLRLRILLGVLLTLVWGLNVSASHLAYHDTFSIRTDASGNVLPGSGGSGAGGGTWYPYPQFDWINQWFYNGPIDLIHHKEIHIEFDVMGTNPTGAPGYLDLALNWATPDWSLSHPGIFPIWPNDLPDPLTEERFIGRQLLASLTPVAGVNTHYSFDWILPFCPEWVSIDVRGSGYWIQNGTITHECVVPTPTAAWGGLGLMSMLVVGLGRRLRHSAA